MKVRSLGCIAVAGPLVAGLLATQALVTGCGGGGGSSIVSQLVTRAAGGTVNNSGNTARVVIPVNSLAADTTVTVQPASGLPAAPAGMAIVNGSGNAFGPNGTALAPAASLVLTYDPTALPTGVTPSGLRICEVVGGAWHDLGGTVDTTAHTVTTPVSSLSTVALLGTITNGTLVPTDFAGNWTGTWVNTTFGSQNNATMTVTVNGATKAVSITLQISGNVLGTFTNPPAETYNGTYDSTHFTIDANSTIFGHATLNIDQNGNLTGHAVTTQNARVSSVDLTGTVKSNKIQATYTVHFRDNTAATGTLNFTK
jgi:hypothetical protein